MTKQKTRKKTTNEIEKFDKVILIATDEQMSAIGMNDKSVNKNLRKYESIVTEIPIKGGFDTSDGNKIRALILNETFTIPETFVKLVGEQNEIKTTSIQQNENDVVELETNLEEVAEEQNEENDEEQN